MYQQQRGVFDVLNMRFAGRASGVFLAGRDGRRGFELRSVGLGFMVFVGSAGLAARGGMGVLHN